MGGAQIRPRAEPCNNAYPQTKRPVLEVVSVDAKVPVSAAGSFFPPNMSLSTDTQLTVELSAKHVPPGSVAKVAVNAFGATRVIVDSTPFAGAEDELTATATITIPAGIRYGAIEAWFESVPIPTL